MRPKIITPPEDEPITIAECRQHLEAQSYGDSDTDPGDDTMIAGMLAAAREHCENFLGLSLSPRTLEIALDKFPATSTDPTLGIELPMGPVRAVEFVGYGGDSDSTDFVQTDEYTLDDFSRPERVFPLSAWPSVTKSTNTVRIRYRAGYGVDTDGGEAIPWAARAAILLILGELYANRENAAEGTLNAIPTSAEALLRPLRVRMGMA